jgi:regulatory protein
VPIITAIEATRRDPARVAVFVDGEFAFALFDELALAAGLRVGDPIDPGLVDRLGEQDAVQRACQAAYQFLGVRPRSEAEVRRRLARRGFESEPVDAAIVRLRQLGYLNDESFAEYWVENRRTFKPQSARMIAHELRQKGVAREAINLSEWDDEAAAVAAGERWIRSRRFADRQEFERKVGGYLQRRGFGGAAIRTATRRLWSGEPAEELASDD